MAKKIKRHPSGIGCFVQLIAAIVFFVGFAGISAFRKGDPDGIIFTFVLWSLSVILIFVGRSTYILQCGNCDSILGKKPVKTCPNCKEELDLYPLKHDYPLE